MKSWNSLIPGVALIALWGWALSLIFKGQITVSDAKVLCFASGIIGMGAMYIILPSRKKEEKNKNG